MYQRTAQDQRIIVGIDGSDCSRAVLVWAVTQAHRTAGIVEVLTVLDEPLPADRPQVYRSGLPDPTAAGERYLADLIADVRTQLGGPPIATLTRVLRGDPAELLLDAAAGAQMLVVGRRGNGDGPGAVSLRCVQHARCSVVVIVAPSEQSRTRTCRGACTPPASRSHRPPGRHACRRHPDCL
jgi:nucleotide-binding universal stress UspA family protein